MYLDAGNAKSYPGSGSTWYDLSGNQHHITLGPSVSFVDSFAGVLNFARDANGYGRNTTINLSNSDYTVMSFVRKNTAGDDGRTITASSNNWLLGHHDTTYGDYYAAGWVYAGAGTSDTVWRMYTGTGAKVADKYSLYINTNLIVAESSGGAAGPIGWNLNNQYGQYSGCQIANLICYSRVLSAAEVQQNYNAIKSRFGL
jgi:hypothetical protein